MAAEVAKELGFETAEDSALEALADVVRYYVNVVARRAAANCGHAKRHDVALNDLLAAFKQGPAASTSWRELRDFSEKWAPASRRDAGCALPAAKRQRAAYYGALGRGDAPRGPRSVHVPKFLPPFPPAVEEKRARRAAAPGGDPRRAARGDGDVREVEALQLALNRIESVRAGSRSAPIDVEAPGAAK
jgi:histone H3/H4